MQQRFVSIWFRHLKTDWFIRRQSALKDIPFVLAAPDHGRMLITASNTAAENEGVYPGMVVADARAVISSLQVLDDIPGLSTKLLTGIGEWCIRFAPAVAIDEPNGLLLEVTGCAHLWGDEKDYLTDIYKRIRQFGYDIKIGIADTIGAAWAIARFGKGSPIVESGQQSKALLSLPAAALRIEPVIAERLEKLGLRQVKDFIHLPRPSLRRRFGQVLLQRINQALGYEEEWITPLQTIEPYQERLPCLEPIVTATGIEIAIQRMLDVLCKRLQQEGKGLRIALLKGYRVDGKVVSIEIGTNRPSCNTKHLFKLFEIKIDSIEPALGIELFTMNALKVEDVSVTQEKLWEQHGGLDDIELSELLDRIEGKMGSNHIHRYVPAEHYWPERSFKLATALNEKTTTPWKIDRPRPLQMLFKPQAIEV
ncbi:MAG TPA: DNA polymerase Y family protein, partial [Ferruginibacter sp.]|nr:DNA polymerase Y family protein [Ferruginibacter sp.]